jgi:hypothetical protein
MATWGANVATEMAWDRISTIEVPTPIAASAEISGSTAPSIERRNAKNNTISASTIPSSRLVFPPTTGYSGQPRRPAARSATNYQPTWQSIPAR